MPYNTMNFTKMHYALPMQDRTNDHHTMPLEHTTVQYLRQIVLCDASPSLYYTTPSYTATEQCNTTT